MILEEFKNFLSQELCNSLIELSLDDLGDTETLGEQIDDYRLAQGTFLDNNEGVASIISQKVSELLSLPTENFENLHVVKYEVGGEYKTHHDFFHETENYYGEQIDRGGQRTFTTLIYLNDTFLGGETDFPLLSKKIKPEIIIHLAAQPLVLDSYIKPIETYESNVIGTLNILRVVRKFNFIKTAVFFTTDKVYKNNDKKKIFNETDSLNGDDPYSGSKAASEIIINSFTKSFLQNNPFGVQFEASRCRILLQRPKLPSLSIFF